MLVALLLEGAALASGSLVHIGPGELGASSRGWLAPGWRLRVPFSGSVRVPNPGQVTVEPVEVSTSAGATRRYSVRLRYTLTSSGEPGLAASTRVEGDIGRALGSFLEQAMTPVVRTAGAASPRAGSAADPMGAAIVAGLSRWGMSVEDLEWRRLDAATGAPIAPLPPPARRRLLLVGLDGADWQILDPLIAQGRLPHLGRLVRSGARAPLRSYDPMISPLIWTTMVTGVGPDVHGVADFLVSDPASGLQVPITSRFRRVKALWNVFSDSGLSSGFVGWWASYPAESVRGFLVTDLMGFTLMRSGGGAPSATSGVTYPEGYYDEIRPRLALPETIGLEDVNRFVRATHEEYARSLEFQPGASKNPEGRTAVQDPIWLVRRTLAMTRNYETIALDLLRKDLDAVGVYFEGIDIMGHRFQHCMPPRVSLCGPDEYARWQSAVTAFYEYQDEVIGRLLAASSGRAIMVVSDHGFRSGSDRPTNTLPYTTGQPVEWHREYGAFILSGPGSRARAVLEKASVYDVAPTLLYLSGLPAASDMRGRVLEEAIDPEYLAAHPPSRIPSYEEVGPARVLPPLTSSPEAQQEMVENLQALGYVGPVPEPGPQGGSMARPGSRVGAGTAAVGERAAAGQSPAPGEESSPAGGAEGTRVSYHRNLATFFMKAGRLDEAAAQLRIANAVKPLPKSYELLSEIRAAKGDVAGAIAELEAGLRTFPEMEPEAVLWMVDLRLGEGRPDLAAEAFARWRPRLTRPALVAACEGKLAAASGDEARAIDLLMTALREEPTLSQAAIAVAPLLDARGRLTELEAPLARAIEAEARLDEYQNLMGLIRLQQGRPSEALASMARALDIDPLNARFLENFTVAARAAGKLDLAVERYKSAVREISAGASVWAGYGRLLGALRRPAEASSAFEKAHLLGERSASTYAGYAASLFEGGRRERSRAILQEGLRLHPADPDLKALQRRIG